MTGLQPPSQNFWLTDHDRIQSAPGKTFASFYDI
jgi:hypothetical protein